MANLIQAWDLSKKFGECSAVNNISFAVREGEILGFVGPSGAGKSTTLALLAQTLLPTSGRIEVAGDEVSGESACIREMLTFVPQELMVDPELSGREYLLFVGERQGLSGGALRRRAESLLDMVQLGESAPEAIQNYSTGMKRRLAFAAGLVREPQILLLDEPLGGADRKSRNLILDSVQRLNREGMTIVYATQDADEAEYLCHRVAIMDGGRIVALDTPRQLTRIVDGLLIRVRFRRTPPKGVLEEIGALPSIGLARWVGDELFILANGSEDTVSAIVNTICRAGLALGRVEILEPSLKSVCLYLLGR